MNNKKRTALIIAVLAGLVFCGTLYRAFFYAASDEIPLPDSMTSGVNEDISNYPARLEVPKLNINAKVTDVGITSRGNMGTPTNYSDVGWYRYGILPGDLGSAVMAGHVDNGLSLPGVFAQLESLALGDDVYVINNKGEKLRFVVSAIDTYDFDAKDTNVFTQNDGKFIKLITCVGAWVKENKTHDKRLVVTARLMP